MVRKFQADGKRIQGDNFKNLLRTELSVPTFERTYELALGKVSNGSWTSFVTSILVTSMMSDFLKSQDQLTAIELEIMNKAMIVKFEQNFNDNFSNLLSGDNGWMNFLEYADLVLEPPTNFERFVSYLVSLLN